MISADFWTFLRRWWWLLVVGTLIAAVSTFIASARQPGIYEARARLLVTPEDTSGTGTDLAAGLSIDQLIATYTPIIQTRRVLETASAESPNLSPDDIAADLVVTPVRGTELLDLLFRASDPATAASVANRIATAAIEQTNASRDARLAARHARLADQVDQLARSVADRTMQLGDVRDQAPDAGYDEQLARAQTALDQAYKAYTNALDTFDSLRLTEASAGSVLTLVEPAAAPTTATLPRTSVNVFIAGVVGLLIAVGVAILLERLTDPLPAPEALARLTGMPVLGLVEAMGGQPVATLVNFANPAPGREAEAFRLLRTAVRGSLSAAGGTILVTSAAAAEGKTTIACGLAVALALADERVILVDASLRRPGLNALVDQAPVLGLGALLADEALPATSVLIPTHLTRLQLIPAGRPLANVGDLLAARRTQQRLSELRGLADVVIVDADALDVSDTLALARSVDQLVWVIDARWMTAQSARQMADWLREAGTAPVGTVVNRAPRATPQRAPNAVGIPAGAA